MRSSGQRPHVHRSPLAVCRHRLRFLGGEGGWGCACRVQDPVLLKDSKRSSEVDEGCLRVYENTDLDAGPLDKS